MKELEIVRQFSAPEDLDGVRAEALRKAAFPAGSQAVVLRRSLDARGRPVYRYRVEVWAPDENYVPYSVSPYQDVHDAAPVAIIGAGPAGMFAALRCLTLGLRPIVLERGKDVHARKVDMAKLSRDGEVNTESNYCYGEGGAGAFSDGKLFTRSSKRGDIREVLYQLVAFGASPSILTEAHPHIGSDKLPGIVENIRRCIVEHGGEYHFCTKAVDFQKNADGTVRVEALRDGAQTSFDVCKVILATGHSARDIYELFASRGWDLEAKGFALGVRVEHPQSLINEARYHGAWKEGLPAAEYSFVQQVDGRGVFSFCMCPGGILVPSSTEPGTVVLNGMSNSSRSSRWANAGVVVSIEPDDVPEKYRGDGPFSLLNYQRDIERSMFLGGSNPMSAPAQRMTDFCKGRVSTSLPRTSYVPGAVSSPLHKMLPDHVAGRLAKAFPKVGIKGYYTSEALLLGTESRTSSPVRIPRDAEGLFCPAFPDLYPCGEGAGFSGGIVSSAIDGIRCAQAIADVLAKE